MVIRRPCAATTSVGATFRTKSRVDSSFQSRRHLDAGQMGISVVRSVGPCLPYDPVFKNRSGFREEAAQSLSARMVHASQRADPGLRIRLWRCESTCARLGGMARL